MKIKDGFVLREMCGEYIVSAEGLQNINFNNVVINGKKVTSEEDLNITKMKHVKGMSFN